MPARIRSHLTFANVVSLMALFIALGGGAYAVASLPKNSVGPRQLKKNAVTRSKIKARSVDASKIKPKSLVAANFAPGVLPTGTNGATGPTGATGNPGSAVAYGAFDGGGGGATVSGPVKNLSNANVSQPPASPGVYCFSNLSFTPNNVVATLDARFTILVVSARIGTVGPCSADTQAVVKAFNPQTGAPADVSFSILFN